MGDKNKEKRKVKRARKALKNEEKVKKEEMQNQKFIDEVEQFTNGFKTPLTSYELKQAMGYKNSFKFTKMEYWDKYMELVKKVEEQRKNNRNRKEISQDDILEQLLKTQNLTSSEENIIKRFLDRTKKIDEEIR